MADSEPPAAVAGFLAWRATFVKPPMVDRDRRWLLRWCAYVAARHHTIWDATEEDAVAMSAVWDEWRWAPRTRLFYVGTMRQFYRWAKEGGRAVDDPWRRIRTPQIPERIHRLPSTSDVAHMLDFLDQPSWRPMRDRALIAFLFSTGCRAAEAVTVRIPDVDLKRREAIILGKYERERVVFLDETAAGAVETWLRRGRVTRPSDPQGCLFVGRFGGGLSLRYPWEIVVRAAEEAGVPRHVHPHILRHLFATDLRENGADLTEIQTLMGHRDINSTLGYIHMATSRLRAAYDKRHTAV